VQAPPCPAGDGSLHKPAEMETCPPNSEARVQATVPRNCRDVD